MLQPPAEFIFFSYSRDEEKAQGVFDGKNGEYSTNASMVSLAPMLEYRVYECITSSSLNNTSEDYNSRIIFSTKNGRFIVNGISGTDTNFHVGHQVNRIWET